MKIILIHKTTKGGYVASVNGIGKAEAFGRDEISALKNLTDRLEDRNPSWIQRSDWEEHATQHHQDMLSETNLLDDNK